MTQDEIEVLDASIAGAAAQIDVATRELLARIRAFDEAAGWWTMNARSCAHYLSWRCGMSLTTAYEKVRVAAALGGLPAIDEAFGEGRLSYSKVRALTRVANAENEADLLEIAVNATGAQLDTICRLYRQTLPPAMDGVEAEDARWVALRDTADGMVRVTAQLRPEEAAAVLGAIDGAADEGSRADRLMAMVNRQLRGDAPRTPVEVVVHVDAEHLTGQIEPTGHGLPAETVRRLCCDAGVVPMLERDGQTIDVGRKTRSIPAALRRALQARDGGCSFPGCPARITEAHHVEHWMSGGPTSLANTALLCGFHHRCVHEHRAQVEMVEGRPVFRDPGGAVIEAVRAPGRIRYPWQRRQEQRAAGNSTPPSPQRANLRYIADTLAMRDANRG